MLEELGLTDVNVVRLPMSGGDVQGISPDNIEPVNPTAYRNIIGKLMYAMVGTRPDIAFAVGVLGRFASNPSKAHFKMAQHTVAYLKGTKDSFLHYRPGQGPLKLEGYANEEIKTHKSTSGYIFLVNGCPVSWASKRQDSVALSSTKAEYMAATQATKEAIWLQHLLADLGHLQKEATVIHKDNHGCIGLSKNPEHHQRTKHIDIQHHFVREKVESNEVTLKACPSADQVADVLTKALPKDKFSKHVAKLLSGLF